MGSTPTVRTNYANGTNPICEASDDTAHSTELIANSVFIRCLVCSSIGIRELITKKAEPDAIAKRNSVNMIISEEGDIMTTTIIYEPLLRIVCK